MEGVSVRGSARGRARDLLLVRGPRVLDDGVGSLDDELRKVRVRERAAGAAGCRGQEQRELLRTPRRGRRARRAEEGGWGGRRSGAPLWNEDDGVLLDDVVLLLVDVEAALRRGGGAVSGAAGQREERVKGAVGRVPLGSALGACLDADGHLGRLVRGGGGVVGLGDAGPLLVEVQALACGLGWRLGAREVSRRELFAETRCAGGIAGSCRARAQRACALVVEVHEVLAEACDSGTGAKTRQGATLAQRLLGSAGRPNQPPGRGATERGRALPASL